MDEVTQSSNSPDTYFAPAGRDSPDAFARKRRIVERSPLLCEVLDAIQDMVLILNEHRQIVAANTAALQMLNVASRRRFGEATGRGRGLHLVEGWPRWLWHGSALRDLRGGQCHPRKSAQEHPCRARVPDSAGRTLGRQFP